MAKKNWVYAAAALIMLLPWLAVTFVKGDGGMAVCLLLFFAIDPLLCICVGIFAGFRLKKTWFHPLLCPAAFLLGTWLCFDMGEPAFLLYAGVYLALGYAAAAVSWLVSKGRKG